jgi:hypothetical protein
MSTPIPFVHHGIYLNGLNAGTINAREKKGLEYAGEHGLHIRHISVDWLTPEPFENLLERVTKTCEAELKQHGTLLLVGASAGGSLAVNVLSKLHSPHLYVVTLCSPLRNPGRSRWYMRRSYQKAGSGIPIENTRFYKSVAYCDATALPHLSPTEKEHIITVKQWADEVVPRTTMDVPGLKSYYVATVGHQYGIAQGIRHLDRVVAKFVG